MKTARQKRPLGGLTYREIFFAHNGPGPWPCYFCSDGIVDGRVYVHHVDENPDNNEPSNLAASHPGCHSAHHAKGIARGGKPLSAEHRAKLSKALTGRVFTTAHRQAISDSWKERRERNKT